ncbi:MAG: DUF971 domain-containing protein [Acidobacteria bacterium]|nr:DUF971 domain-containing protein [Acidobacteriota bacterium]
MPWPTQPTPMEIGRAGESDIQIRWSDGKIVIYPARFLRLACPCAVCVDETTGRRILVVASVPPDVRPLAIEPVGRYAISIRWSDGHSTGIYTWEWLYQLAGELPKQETQPPEK